MIHLVPTCEGCQGRQKEHSHERSESEVLQRRGSMERLFEAVQQQQKSAHVSSPANHVCCHDLLGKCTAAAVTTTTTAAAAAVLLIFSFTPVVTERVFGFSPDPLSLSLALSLLAYLPLASLSLSFFF